MAEKELFHCTACGGLFCHTTPPVGRLFENDIEIRRGRKESYKRLLKSQTWTVETLKRNPALLNTPELQEAIEIQKILYEASK